MSVNPSKGSKQSFSDDLSINDSDKLGVNDLGGDEPSLDPLANAGERKRFSGGSIVLIIVIGLALAGLWFMRSLSHVAAASSASNELEATIQRFLNGHKGATAGEPNASILTSADPTVLTVLSEAYTQRQVPLTNVKTNPFILPGEGIPTPTHTEDPNSKNLARLQQDKKTLFEHASAKLQLKSIIMSGQPLANISGKIIRTGDELVVDPENVSFHVDDITAEAVTVTAEDNALDVSLTVVLTLKRDR